MPLLVPGLVEPKSKEEESKDKKQDKNKDKKEDKPAETKSADSTETKKIDGRKAPGMEGMSDEAIRKFEEAMELEYQKREGGA
jgi:hypothetical protein